MRRLAWSVAASLSLLSSGPLVAGGFEYPDHDPAALGRGGSAVAATEGVSATYYNPAGLADLDGLRLTLDGEATWLSTRFQRTVDDGSGNLVPTGDAVSNDRKPWVAPFLGVSYQLMPGLSLAVAGWGPSAVAWRRYPDPRKLQPTAWDGNPDNDPDDYAATSTGAPQRYNLIDSTIIVAYPSLAVAYRPVKWVSIGATGQLVLTQTSFSQAVYSGIVAGEDPRNDAIAELDVESRPKVVGILGLQVHPIESLSLGVSWRPGFTVESEGTLRLTFSDPLAKTAELLGGLEQTGDAATFIADFPQVLRFGAAYAGKGWLAEVGGTWEGWSRVQAFHVKTDGVKVFLGDIQVDVPEIVIPKKWKDTFSLRLGGRFELGELIGADLPLTLRAGYVYETGAAPASTLALDFITTARNQVTFGLSWAAGPVTIHLAASRIFQSAVTVTESEVVQTASPPPGLSYDGLVVGTGTYEAGLTLLELGIEGHFLAE